MARTLDANSVLVRTATRTARLATDSRVAPCRNELGLMQVEHELSRVVREILGENPVPRWPSCFSGVLPPIQPCGSRAYRASHVRRAPS